MTQGCEVIALRGPATPDNVARARDFLAACDRVVVLLEAGAGKSDAGREAQRQADAPMGPRPRVRPAKVAAC